MTYSLKCQQHALTLPDPIHTKPQNTQTHHASLIVFCAAEMIHTPHKLPHVNVTNCMMKHSDRSRFLGNALRNTDLLWVKVPGTEAGRSVLDVLGDVLGVHFACECVHGAQINRHDDGGDGWGVALRALSDVLSMWRVGGGHGYRRSTGTLVTVARRLCCSALCVVIGQWGGGNQSQCTTASHSTLKQHGATRGRPVFALVLLNFYIIVHHSRTNNAFTQHLTRSTSAMAFMINMRLSHHYGQRRRRQWDARISTQSPQCTDTKHSNTSQTHTTQHTTLSMGGGSENYCHCGCCSLTQNSSAFNRTPTNTQTHA